MKFLRYILHPIKTYREYKRDKALQLIAEEIVKSCNTPKIDWFKLN